MILGFVRYSGQSQFAGIQKLEFYVVIPITIFGKSRLQMTPQDYCRQHVDNCNE